MQTEEEKSPSPDVNVICGECDKALAAKSSLWRHFQAVHSMVLAEPPKTMECFECLKSFSIDSKLQLWAHSVTVHNGEQQPSMTCCDCGKKFCSKRGLSQHLSFPANHSVLDRNVAFWFKCFTCSRSFCDRLKLSAHHRKLVCTFLCFECPLIFTSKIGLLRHFASCPRGCPVNIPFCYDCNWSFSARRALIVHSLSVHLSFRPKSFRCEQCEYACEFSYSLKKHVEKVHMKKTSTNCPQCQKRFYGQQELNKHMKWTHVDADLKPRCYECAAAFSNLEQLRNHQMTHFEKTNFVCDECGKMCKRLSEMIRHLVMHRDSGKHGGFTCEVCQTTFSCLAYLSQHRNKLVHGSKKNVSASQWSCVDCPRVFKSAINLKLHSDAVHRKLKEHQCAVCLKSCTRLAHVQSHSLRHHGGEKPFKCDECSKTFNNKSDMSHHMLEHVYAHKTYRCGQCQYSTYSLKNLKLHQQIHGNHWHHKCTVCGKQFRQSAGLRKHEKVHGKKALSLPMLRSGTKNQRNC